MRSRLCVLEMPTPSLDQHAESDECTIPDAPLLKEISIAVHARSIRNRQWLEPLRATRRHNLALRELGLNMRKNPNWRPTPAFFGEALYRLLDMAEFYGVDAEKEIRAYHERQLSQPKRHLNFRGSLASRNLTVGVTLALTLLPL